MRQSSSHNPDVILAGSGPTAATLQASRTVILRRQALADRQREEVDDLVDVRPDEMRAENAIRLFFDEHLEPVDGLGDAPLHSDLSPCSRACLSPRPAAAMGGVVKATLGTPV